jgi:Ca-activated chloride channel family protein
MKVRTVAALAALGMTFSSFTVWSLTDPDRAVGPVGGERWTDRRSPLPSPKDGPAGFEMKGTLAVTGRLAHERLASDRESETFVLVNVRADERATGQRAERHLSIVIDRSGSMQGKRMENAIAAARGAVERLGNDDFVSVVDYATTANVLIPTTRVDSQNRFRVVDAIGRLTASGDTCISCGLETARNMAQTGRGAVERVLLISDGQATTGVRDVDGMRRVAETLRTTGATVTTIGVDVDYDERMMSAIAQETNGRHYFVSSPDGLARIFDTELSGLERTVAREARLELEFAPGIQLEDVVDRSFQREGGRAIVPLGTFAAGEERTVLARVRVPRGAAGERDIVTARMVYDDLESGSGAREEARLAVVLTNDGSSSPMDPIVQERVDRSGTVTALDEANRLFESGDAEKARERVALELDKVKRGRSRAVASAAPAAKAALDKDFARQEVALDEALGGFAAPPPQAAPTPEAARPGKSALKKNQETAADLAF